MWIPPVVGGLLALLALWRSLRNGRLARLIADLPTTPTSGVYIGLNEVKGQATSECPHVSYLAEAVCVYSRYSIRERWSRMVTETYRDSKGRTRTRTRRESGWKTVDSDEEIHPFMVRDADGELRVLPAGADIEALQLFSRRVRRGDPLYYGKGPPGAVMDSDHVRQFVEWGIPVGAHLYILGQARERQDVVAAEIALSKGNPFYLISTRTEAQVLSAARGRAWAWNFFGAFTSVAGAVWLPLSEGSGDPILPGVLAASMYLLAWSLGHLFMTHNSLLRLRNRVRQAVSLIEIQAKRRADLIPSLVEVVRAGREHSLQVQEMLARLRASLVSFESVRAEVMVLQEALPSLQEEPLFADLQKRLIDSEDRLMLARSHHRALASAYNSRLERLPDRWIAFLSAHHPVSLTDAGMGSGQAESTGPR